MPIKNLFLSAWVISLLCVPSLALGQFGDFEVPLPRLPISIDDAADPARTANPILNYASFIINFFTAVIVAVGLIMVVAGGYLYMTAGGNTSQLDTAKSYIKGALLGIILALSAYLILNTISSQFASGLKEPSFGPLPSPVPTSGTTTSGRSSNGGSSTTGNAATNLNGLCGELETECQVNSTAPFCANLSSNC